MENSFWVQLTEKDALGEQNWGHRKSQDYLKLLTSVGKPHQGWVPQGAKPGSHVF